MTARRQGGRSVFLMEVDTSKQTHGYLRCTFLRVELYY